MSADSVAVATAGYVDRNDRCESCGGPMIYRTAAGVIVSTFCGSYGCPRWLKELPEVPVLREGA